MPVKMKAGDKRTYPLKSEGKAQKEREHLQEESPFNGCLSASKGTEKIFVPSQNLTRARTYGGVSNSVVSLMPSLFWAMSSPRDLMLVIGSYFQRKSLR